MAGHDNCLEERNSILEKPNKLTNQEFAVVRQHTYHTYSILQRCGLPRNIIEWAAFHHEKLNRLGQINHIFQRSVKYGNC